MQEKILQLYDFFMKYANESDRKTAFGKELEYMVNHIGEVKINQYTLKQFKSSIRSFRAKSFNTDMILNLK